MKKKYIAELEKVYDRNTHTNKWQISSIYDENGWDVQVKGHWLSLFRSNIQHITSLSDNHAFKIITDDDFEIDGNCLRFLAYDRLDTLPDFTGYERP